MKVKLLKAMFSCGLASSIALVANGAHALCSDQRHPGVTAEFKTSATVLMAIVVSSRDESSQDDPQGIADTVYTVRVLDVFKGKPGSSLEITSENTSSRFPMTVGKKYLLFVNNNGETHFVDSCGRSGLLTDRMPELQAVKKQASSQSGS